MMEYILAGADLDMEELERVEAMRDESDRLKVMKYFEPADGMSIIDSVNKKIKDTNELEPRIARKVEEILRPYITNLIKSHSIIRKTDIEHPTKSNRPFSHLWGSIFTNHADQISLLPVMGQEETITNIQLDIFITEVLMKKVMEKWIALSTGQRLRLTDNWPPTAY